MAGIINKFLPKSSDIYRWPHIFIWDFIMLPLDRHSVWKLPKICCPILWNSEKTYLFKFEEMAGKFFFSSLNIGNINFYKTNTMEMKKKCPDNDKRKFWCDNSFQSAATAFFLKTAKSVIVVSMTLRYHGNEWDDLPVLFQFSCKNKLYFQYFKVSIKYYCRINYSYLPLSGPKLNYRKLAHIQNSIEGLL